MNNNKILMPIAIIISSLIIGMVMYITRTGNNNIAEKKINEKKVENFLPFASPGTPAKINPKYDYILGNKNASFFILEYSDLECPFCKTYHNDVKSVLKKYSENDKVSFVFRNFPLSSPVASKNIHPSALKEAEALECVGKISGDKKYYEFIDLMFELTKSDGKFNTNNLSEIVKNIGVDKSKFEACMNDNKIFAKVKNSFDEGVNAGVQGTPAVFIIASDGLATRIPNTVLKADLIEKIIKDAISK